MKFKALPDRLEEKFLVLVLAACLGFSLLFAETIVRTESTHIVETSKRQAEYLTALQEAGIELENLFEGQPNDQEAGYIQVFEDNPLLNPRVTSLRAKLFLAAILLAGVLVISLRTVFRILVIRRVQNLEEATRSLARHEHVEFPESVDDEIGSLIHSFRDMVISLEHREAELTIRNEQLKSEALCRKAAVDSLRESENKFRVLFEKHTDGIIVIVDGDHIHGNTAAVQMLGYENEDEFLDRKPNETWPTYQPDGSPSFEEAQAHSAYAYEHGTHQYEWVFKRPNGTTFWADTVATVIPYEGRRALYMAIRDISSRKEEEDEHVRLTAAMEQTVEMIVVSDAQGQIQYVNPAYLEISGYTRAEVIGQSHALVQGFEQDNPNHEEMQNAIRNGEVWKGKLVSTKKDGTRYQSETTISPVRDNRGQIIDYVTVSHDVTKEARLEAQLVHAQKMEAIGELASGIAHEINTPTQYIGDNIRFLQESYNDIEKVIVECQKFIALEKTEKPNDPRIGLINELIEEIDLEYLREEMPAAINQSMEGNKRVAEIVRAMKEFAHPGTEELSPMDINQAIQNTISVARNEWKYVAEVKTDLSPTLPMVNCVPGAFNQVLLNIFVNAAHAISDTFENNDESKGTISVSTQRDDKWVEIRISDTGNGIPDKIRTKIFDPFFTTKGVGKGTGQGLAMAHAVIVDKHKGTLMFETEEGKGTTFIIRLLISGVLAEEDTEETDHVDGHTDQHARV